LQNEIALQTGDFLHPDFFVYLCYTCSRILKYKGIKMGTEISGSDNNMTPEQRAKAEAAAEAWGGVRLMVRNWSRNYPVSS